VSFDRGVPTLRSSFRSFVAICRTNKTLQIDRDEVFLINFRGSASLKAYVLKPPC
jgi:hypothetical protein